MKKKVVVVYPKDNIAPEPALMAPFETDTLRRYVAASSTPRRGSMRTLPLVQTGLLPEPSSTIQRSSCQARCERELNDHGVGDSSRDPLRA